MVVMATAEVIMEVAEVHRDCGHCCGGRCGHGRRHGRGHCRGSGSVVVTMINGWQGVRRGMRIANEMKRLTGRAQSGSVVFVLVVGDSD